MIIEKFKNLSTKVKLFFGAIITILGSLFIIGQRKKSLEKSNRKSESEISELRGKNNILLENTDKNNEEISLLDDEISEVKRNIKNIDEDSNNDNLDDFFDKRGF